MPLAQVPNRSLTIAPHSLGDFRVALRKPFERVSRSQVVGRRERCVDKVQVPAPYLAQKQAASLCITIQALDVLPEHVEHLLVKVEQDSPVSR